MSAPTLQSVLAQAENALAATFDQGIYFSQLLDTNDASKPSSWQVLPISGTVGYDGLPARSVSVVSTSVLTVDGSGNTKSVLVTLDRPLSPYPAQYTLVAVGIWNAAQTLSGTTAVNFPSVYRQLQPAQVQSPALARDFANPQTLSGAVGSTVDKPYQQPLGSLGYAVDHDYAIDQADVGLMKRIARRLFTKKNGFAFLPGYGVGVTAYGKRLSKASVREQLAADCEAQISREPEVARVVVSLRQDAANPQLVRVGIFVTKRSGKTVRYTALIPPAAG